MHSAQCTNCTKCKCLRWYIHQTYFYIIKYIFLKNLKTLNNQCSEVVLQKRTCIISCCWWLPYKIPIRYPIGTKYCYICDQNLLSILFKVWWNIVKPIVRRAIFLLGSFSSPGRCFEGKDLCVVCNYSSRDGASQCQEQTVQHTPALRPATFVAEKTQKRGDPSLKYEA